jgi:hypothetical protein
MGDIKIDGKLFQERINHFVNAWKADKRAGDVIFNGVSSMVILMGKLAEDAPEFHKNNAVHVCLSQSAMRRHPSLCCAQSPGMAAP